MNFKFLITLIIGLSSITFGRTAIAAPSTCRVIAYVIDSRDNQYQPGQRICFGETIPKNAKVVIACTNSNVSFLVRDNRQLRACETSSLNSVWSDTKNRARGDDKDSIILISPTGKYLINGKLVKLIWLPLKNTDKYTVSVLSASTKRADYIVKTNSLSIPLLGKDLIYSIIIRAYSSLGMIASNIFELNKTSQNSLITVSEYVKNIDKMVVDSQTKNLLKIRIFRSYNLLNEETSILRAHLFKYPNDYKGYLHLGDALISQGLVSEAQVSYEKSKAIAVNIQDVDFIKIIDLRLNLVGGKS